MRRLRPKSALAGPRAAGIVLLDSSLQAVYANEEALEILSYPENGRKNGSPDAFLNKRIRSLFPDPSRTTALTGLISGRRRYLFRTFSLQSATNNGSQMAILIERNRRPSVNISQFAEQFRLTPSVPCPSGRALRSLRPRAATPCTCRSRVLSQLLSNRPPRKRRQLPLKKSASRTESTQAA